MVFKASAVAVNPKAFPDFWNPLESILVLITCHKVGPVHLAQGPGMEPATSIPGHLHPLDQIELSPLHGAWGGH